MAASKDSSLFPSDFAWLAQGKSLGKRVQLLIDPDDSGSLTENPFVNVLELNGPDEAAMNVQMTIIPIRVIRIGSTPAAIAAARALVQAQAASGSIDTFSQFASQAFPVLSPPSISYTPMIARVDWGIGGIANKDVDVDIGQGLNVNLTCSFLRVNVAIEPFLEFLPGNYVGEHAIYELGAFVGPGFAKRNNAQRTIPLRRLFLPDSTASGLSQVVPIPKFATRVSLVVGGGAFTDPDALRGWYAQIIFMRYSLWGPGFAAVPPNFISDYSMGVMTATDESCCQFMIPNGATYCFIRSTFSPSTFPPFSAEFRPYLIFDLGI